MSTVDRGVHADRPLDVAAVIGPREQCLVDLVPGTVLAEPTMPLPHRLPGPERLRKIPLREPAAIAVDHTLDHLPMITHRPTLPRPLRRKKGLDQLPLVITEKRFTTHPTKTADTDPPAFGDTP